MNKTIKIIIGIIALSVVLYLIYHLVPGKLSVVYDTNSPIKDGIKYSLNTDSYTKQYDIPTINQLKSGTYHINAQGTNTNIFSNDFKISPFLTTTVKVSIDIKSPGELIPYYNNFPYVTGDYRADINVEKKDNTWLTSKITITLYLTSASGDPQVLQDAEKSTKTDEAKKWLKDIGVPDDIPVETTTD